MALNLSESGHRAETFGGERLAESPRHGSNDAFSTALFTGLNIMVFLILAASVAAAAVIYSQGA